MYNLVVKMVKCYRKKYSYSDFWVTSNERLSDFYASSWQRGDSAVPMLVIRVILTTLVLTVLVWSLVEAPNQYWLLYLTNWGLLLVAMMMVSGTVVSIVAVCNRNFEGDELPWYVSMYWFIYNIAITVALLITILYWVLLYDPEIKDDPRMFWLDLATHGFNSCIAFAELLFSRTPVRILHLYQPLGAGLWYSAFTAIYYAAGGIDGNGNPFIYEILDWRQSRRAATIVTIAIGGLIVVYTILWSIALCRDKISTALLRTTSHDLTPPDKNFAQRIV